MVIFRCGRSRRKKNDRIHILVRNVDGVVIIVLNFNKVAVRTYIFKGIAIIRFRNDFGGTVVGCKYIYIIPGSLHTVRPVILRQTFRIGSVCEIIIFNIACDAAG